MQARTRAARWLDWILGSCTLFFLSFLWFAVRTGALLPAAVLAGAWTALALYAVRLWSCARNARSRGREAQARRQQAALYALTMLPQGLALSYAAQALAQAYSLQRAGSSGPLCFFTDRNSQRIAMGLDQSPQPADVHSVYTFHRARRSSPGVLVCAGGATGQAQEYAQSLTPPLRLIAAGELPLPRALYESDPAQQAPAQRTKRPALAEIFSPAQALRYWLMGLLLTIAYLLTGQLTCLLPALGLVFLALVCKGRQADQKELFGRVTSRQN